MSDDQIYVAFAVTPVVSSDEIDAAHSEALTMDAQMMHDAWDNADEIGRLIELEYAYDEALKNG